MEKITIAYDKSGNRSHSDVHDWATQSPSKAAGERHTNAHHCFMVWKICRGVENGVTLKSA